MTNEMYATTSNGIVSVVNQEGSMYAQTRRILSTGTDIERLDRLNSLLRRMTARKPPVEEVRAELAVALSLGIVLVTACMNQIGLSRRQKTVKQVLKL